MVEIDYLQPIVNFLILKSVTPHCKVKSYFNHNSSFLSSEQRPQSCENFDPHNHQKDVQSISLSSSNHHHPSLSWLCSYHLRPISKPHLPLARIAAFLQPLPFLSSSPPLPLLLFWFVQKLLWIFQRRRHRKKYDFYFLQIGLKIGWIFSQICLEKKTWKKQIGFSRFWFLNVCSGRERI